MISFKNQKILIVAPHPDDEVIGCGGLIQKVKEDGGKVYVLFLTVGDTLDFSNDGYSTESARKEEIEKVAKFLSYDDYYLAFPGNGYHLKLDLLGQRALMDMIERESPISIEKVKPNIILFPEATSYNQDHHISAVAAHASLRNSSAEKYFVPTSLSYESVADFWALETKSTPNVFVPLTTWELNTKLKALKLYSSQWRTFPSSRSQKSLTILSELRGSECMSKLAEGFILHRGIAT